MSWRISVGNILQQSKEIFEKIYLSLEHRQGFKFCFVYTFYNGCERFMEVNTWISSYCMAYTMTTGIIYFLSPAILFSRFVNRKVCRVYFEFADIWRA